MTSYSEDRNPVDDILFELLKDMPEVLPPLREQLSSELLRDVVRQHPKATLIELCQMVEHEHGIELSTTSMSRLLREQGLTCKARRQLAVSAKPYILSKAA